MKRDRGIHKLIMGRVRNTFFFTIEKYFYKNLDH